MPIVPFATGTKRGESIAIDTEALENLYIEMSQSGKSIASLIVRPGLETEAVLGNLEIRGMLVTGDSTTRFTLWAVHGANLIRIRDGEAPTGVGSLVTSEGPCYLASNGSEIMVTDGANGYIHNIATEAFTQLNTGTHGWTLVAPRFVAYLSTYFVVLDANDGSYNISDNNNGLSWNATDKGFAETDPDGTVSLVANNGELWLFGTRSTEIHYVTSAADFPFAAKLSATIQWGTAAPFSVAQLDNALVYLAQSKQGGLRVMRLPGYVPERISGEAFEHAVTSYTRVDDAVGFGFDWHSHAFYVLTFPSEDKSWMFDLASRQWAVASSLHEVQTSGGAAARTIGPGPDASGWVLGRRYLGQWAVGRENDVLVSDYRGGTIYRVRDNGVDGVAPIYVRGVGATLNDNEQWQTHSNFQMVCEHGTGVSGDPVIELRWSNDNGFTWSNWYPRKLGPLGRYDRRARWNRLGRARNRTYEFRITDATPKKVIGMVVSGGP